MTSRNEGGLGIQSYDYNPHFNLGNIIHYALEEYYLNGTPLDQAYREAVDRETAQLTESRGALGFSADEVEQIDAQQKLALAMLRGYQEWVALDQSEYNDANLEWLEAETDLELNWGGATLALRVDGVVRVRSTGELFVVEHKTAKDSNTVLHGGFYDFQPRFYTWVYSKFLGQQVSGVMYNLLLKFDPYNIPVLRNGWPSRSKQNVRTNPEIYSNLLEQTAHDLEQPIPQAHLDFVEHLETSDQRLFRRVVVRYSDQEMQDMDRIVEQKIAAHRATLDAGINAIPLWNRYSCVRCWLKGLCTIMTQGGDWQGYVRENYRSELYDGTSSKEIEG
jgi:hypothetical protein